MAAIIESNTPESNVKIMHGFVRELQQEKRIDLFDQYFAPDFVDHPVSGGTVGADHARMFMNALHESVDDLECEIIDCVGTGDIVATHKVFRGTLNRDFLGNPKGHKMDQRVMDFMRFRDGKVVEHWATHNPIGSMGA